MSEPHRASRNYDVLPISLPPRGLRREEAAAYIGVSPSMFDTMVDDERMPKPKHVNRCRIWDRMELDFAFTALPNSDGTSGRIDAGEDEPPPVFRV